MFENFSKAAYVRNGELFNLSKKFLTGRFQRVNKGFSIYENIRVKLGFMLKKIREMKKGPSGCQITLIL